MHSIFITRLPLVKIFTYMPWLDSGKEKLFVEFMWRGMFHLTFPFNMTSTVEYSRVQYSTVQFVCLLNVYLHYHMAHKWLALQTHRYYLRKYHYYRRWNCIQNSPEEEKWRNPGQAIVKSPQLGWNWSRCVHYFLCCVIWQQLWSVGQWGHHWPADLPPSAQFF